MGNKYGHLAGEGKCQALTTVGADMLLEKGSRRESICHAMVYVVQPQHTVAGKGGYRKAYSKIVRGSDGRKRWKHWQ